MNIRLLCKVMYVCMVIYIYIALSVSLPMKQVTHTGHTTSRKWRYHVYNLVLAAGMMVFTSTNMNLLLPRPPATKIKHQTEVVVVPFFSFFFVLAQTVTCLLLSP